ncbi:MAG TPA: GNAT family N-acetyltransferase [Blastocatellia bacterium]|nr:GNAT family N-acetyltransferase [Blastocatellia bacterium]
MPVDVPAIETARLFMRPFEPGDADNLHRVFVDADVRRFLLDDQVVSRDWVEEEIAASIARFEAGSAGLFCVFLKNDQTLIGFCGFRPFFEPPQLQLLYGLLPAYWSRGLATEAARAMIEFGFGAVGFDRIPASADPPNGASIRVLEKAGMSFDRRETIGGLDTVFYAVDR